MTLDEVLNEWDKDAVIDRTELGNAALDGSRLHAKWLRIRSHEKLRLAKLLEEGKQLKRDKHEFYTQGPTKETQERGWELPAMGRVTNTLAPMYMDADKQTVEHNLRVAYQREIVDAVELIFVALKGRGFDIGRKLDELKLRMGS